MNHRPGGGRTPDELESLLEDAVVLRDAPAVAALFERGGTLVAGPGAVATGRGEIECAAPALWACGYVADPRRVLRADGLAFVVGPRSVTVARSGDDGIWRYACAVFRSPGETSDEDPCGAIGRSGAQNGGGSRPGSYGCGAVVGGEVGGTEVGGAEAGGAGGRDVGGSGP